MTCAARRPSSSTGRDGRRAGARDGVDDQAVLDAARAAGAVREFLAVTATLTELFREVVGSMTELSCGQAARLVAVREITQRGKDKSFLISLGITLAIVLVIIGISKATSGTSSYDVGVGGPRVCR